MNEKFELGHELTMDQEEREIIHALTKPEEAQREATGLRSQISGALNRFPELCDHLELFRALMDYGVLPELLQRATPEVMSQLLDMTASLEKAKASLLAFANDGTMNPAFFAARMENYLKLYPDLANDYDLYAEIAKNPKLEHLLVFASPEVIKRIDTEIK